MDNKFTKRNEFKKQYPKEKLFSVQNFSYDKRRFLMYAGYEVREFAKEKFNLDITRPRQFESFLRKSYRALWKVKTKKNE